ncbi:MAG: N-acetylneuraminate synthase family protein [Gemmatimonadaceae bacterium]
MQSSFRSSLKGGGAGNAGAGGCLVIGEVAQAHDGSLGAAHAFIDAIAASGADAVKFQTHIAAAESTPQEPWRVEFSKQDATRYDYWKRMEFSEEQWVGLRQHASEKRLLFLSSPFSLEATELLDRLGVAAWKVASGEIANEAMIDRMLESRIPLILSTGMSPLSEVDATVERVKKAGVPLAVLQCTTAYPCPPEKIGLNLLSLYRSRYGVPVGLSDHSGTIYPGLAAAALGADVLEVHVTLSRDAFGPDVTASVTNSELKQLVEGIRFIEKILANPLDKEQLGADVTSLRGLFTKSVVARIPIPAGTVLGSQHLAAKKPGTGIPAARLPSLIGARTVRAIAQDEMLSDADVSLEKAK